MKIVIQGAGALGAYFGGRLQEAGQDVTFLVRKGRAEQLRQHGLAINSVKGNYKIEPLHFIEKAEELEEVDLVITAVKGYHLQGALDDLKTFVKKGAKVLPLLNGMEHFDVLQRALGKENVLGGLAFIIATLDEKGHVVHTSEQHRIVFGPLDPSQKEMAEEFRRIIGKANVQSEYSDQINQALWEKYVFITAFSGITTASNMPIGPVRSTKETFSVYKDLVKEMAELAKAYGYPLTDEKQKGIIHTVFQLPEDSTSSMHQDKRKGLPLEVEHLQGGALRMAEKKGCKLPVLKTIYGLIKLFEK
ncbi:ketopantoate reductase family protein [Fervidibacillus halotolerans]|uniref:2-dehydropantoate 2-reductase n=1 Tax=Fervidibacillus halotolerans TaxID=2980027 RepID=A0A9E8RYZ3_9BACI|nr:ketopantoate reductase family protein [Fervidibacillus halotolerans]WAA13351.1 ketopantoate reductase family protein [Fervidibacillus halotolerans]